ncbi:MULTISPECIES: GNAT family N-acetyltransferase [unclassified Methanoculleus]|uniref:GNAT family N-acetyltransferase n=1 Tax=Methanoculleus palmolei TaxID=72612 RepID=A0ABD8A8C9_9EURY|nr:GNAT family N-acetyltransferase [Methanoculleus sp. UBA377]MDD2472948.1 GNAT family N-acetyltransferase [Methanoculleus sp.]WOX55780.1 GNAT family N-acetyltransferase [Methanoculleus palmolei]
MKLYTVAELEFGSEKYEQTVLLRDKVMRKPLGLSIKNDDLSFERYATVLAVFESDTILGTGTFVSEDEGTAKIRYLCVDPELQKSGVGRAIIEDIEQRSKRHGIRKICLESRVTAMGFYKNLGYREYGDTYLMNEAPVDHIWMEKKL